MLRYHNEEGHPNYVGTTNLTNHLKHTTNLLVNEKIEAIQEHGGHRPKPMWKEEQRLTKLSLLRLKSFLIKIGRLSHQAKPELLKPKDATKQVYPHKLIKKNLEPNSALTEENGGMQWWPETVAVLMMARSGRSRAEEKGEGERERDEGGGSRWGRRHGGGVGVRRGRRREVVAVVVFAQRGTR